MIVLMFLFLSMFLQIYAFTPEITQYVEEMPRNIQCLLGADIGGTTSKVGIFKVEKGKATLLISFRIETKTIGDFPQAMNELLTYLETEYGITIKHACIAAPGIATKNKDYSGVHGLFDIYTSELLEQTSLETAIIVNDLFVVGHGLDSINPENLTLLYGKKIEDIDHHNMRAVVSAGTGIGSSTITWDTKKHRYITHPGEAGMLEFSPTNQLEYTFANHIRNFYGRDATYWANLASGSGVTRIYSMLKLMDNHEDTLYIDDHDPMVILQNPQDELCKATSDLFIKLFGRFTRNYVWSIMPYGGLYIVGGVPTAYPELFNEEFAGHYEDPRFFRELREIPIYMVTDPNVGLYGAVNYLLLELKDQQANKPALSVTIANNPSMKQALAQAFAFFKAFFYHN